MKALQFEHAHFNRNLKPKNLSKAYTKFPQEIDFFQILKLLTFILKQIPYHAVNSTTSKVNVHSALTLINT